MLSSSHESQLRVSVSMCAALCEMGCADLHVAGALPSLLEV